MNIELLYEDLLWLPRAPERFREMVNDISSITEIYQLANFGLDDRKLNLLYRKIKALRAAEKANNKSQLTKICFVSASVFDFLPPSLVATGLRHKLDLDVECIQFEHFLELVEQDDEDHALDGKYDFLILALDLKWLPHKIELGNIDSCNSFVDKYLQFLDTLTQKIIEKFGSKVIIQNIVDQNFRLFGNYESIIPGTLSYLTDRLNYELKAIINPDVLYFDIDQLASTVGRDLWLDPTVWDLAKLPFSLKFLPLYCEMVCRIVSSRMGGARRAIVIDLDNTLWGGVIGDDGIEGIYLGNGHPIGEAFVRFQFLIKELRSRGIVISVSSKNNHEIALDVFRRHPEMVLKENDIAVFRANWEDKASNIKYISEILGLGLDSFVFIDDNPAERLLVRQQLPMVAVLELPENPAYFNRYLLAAGYFEAFRLSAEDLNRAEYYNANAKRLEFKSKAGDLTQFLLSLEMKLTVQPFDAIGRTRIAQLIGKSNQFNLTTKRYDELELEFFENCEEYFTIQARLEDLFGDNGMICVVICRKFVEYWEIDTWLMSCRVLGRMVESAILNHLVSAALIAGASKIVGLYKPTSKNSLVKNHYLKLGFTYEYLDAEGHYRWALDLDKYSTIDIPIKIKK